MFFIYMWHCGCFGPAYQSVLYGLLTRKPKGAENQNNDANIPQGCY